MNGKKAKLLRSLAGPKQPTQYKAMEGTSRKKAITTGPQIDSDGSQKLDENGEKLYHHITWTTQTVMIAAGSRMVTKVLKNIYRNRTRGLPVNMHSV